MTSTERILLNVGGTKYEVSRSLIETYPNTMLARLISDTWLNNPEEEVFIDRNGPRFQYILDYMRDRKAHLAVNVSKAAVLQELEYFGFEGVPTDAMDGGFASLEAAKHVAMLSTEHTNNIAHLEATKDYEIFAHACYQKFSQTGDLTIRSGTEFPIHEILNRRCRQAVVEGSQKSFVKYGLKCTSITHSNGTYFVKLSEIAP